MNTSPSRLVSVFDAIQLAHKEKRAEQEAAGQAVLTPIASAPDQRFEHTKAGQSISWTSGSFGKVTVTVQKPFRLGAVQGDTRHVRYAEVSLGVQEPATISFKIEHQLPKAIRLLHAMDGVVTDVTNAPINFAVPTEWSIEGDRSVPKTRVRGKDNFDLVFLLADPTDGHHNGKFLQLQISVCTRGGKFWLTMQEVFCGQIARTTEAKARGISQTSYRLQDGRVTLVVPVFGEHSFPGADYLRVFPKMGPKVIEYAVANGASVTLSQCSVSPWAPVKTALPAKMAEKGWSSAEVLFFNAVTGIGRAITEDGETCFLHFKFLLDSQGRQVWTTGFPLLLPSTTIALKRERSEQGFRATAIRDFTHEVEATPAATKPELAATAK